MNSLILDSRVLCTDFWWAAYTAENSRLFSAAAQKDWRMQLPRERQWQLL